MSSLRAAALLALCACLATAREEARAPAGAAPRPGATLQPRSPLAQPAPSQPAFPVGGPTLLLIARAAPLGRRGGPPLEGAGAADASAALLEAEVGAALAALAALAPRVPCPHARGEPLFGLPRPLLRPPRLFEPGARGPPFKPPQRGAAPGDAAAPGWPGALARGARRPEPRPLAFPDAPPPTRFGAPPSWGALAFAALSLGCVVVYVALLAQCLALKRAADEGRADGRCSRCGRCGAADVGVVVSAAAHAAKEGYEPAPARA